MTDKWTPIEGENQRKRVVSPLITSTPNPTHDSLVLLFRF
jgi:hypothetical protein